jgi:hypothetical protein
MLVPGRGIYGSFVRAAGLIRPESPGSQIGLGPHRWDRHRRAIPHEQARRIQGAPVIDCTSAPIVTPAWTDAPSMDMPANGADAFDVARSTVRSKHGILTGEKN